MSMDVRFKPGLEGIVAAETRLSYVDGLAGELIIAGFPLDDIAANATLFTPTFAIGRVVGWTAHCLEQQTTGRLIRPQSHYIGGRDQKWLSVENR